MTGRNDGAGGHCGRAGVTSGFLSIKTNAGENIDVSYNGGLLQIDIRPAPADKEASIHLNKDQAKLLMETIWTYLGSAQIPRA